MGIIRWADVFHFEDIAAFGASSDGAVAGHLLWSKEEGLGVGLIPLGARAIEKDKERRKREGGHTVSQMTTWESTG